MDESGDHPHPESHEIPPGAAWEALKAATAEECCAILAARDRPAAYANPSWDIAAVSPAAQLCGQFAKPDGDCTLVCSTRLAEVARHHMPAEYSECHVGRNNPYHRLSLALFWLAAAVVTPGCTSVWEQRGMAHPRLGQ